MTIFNISQCWRFSYYFIYQQQMSYFKYSFLHLSYRQNLFLVKFTDCASETFLQLNVFFAYRCTCLLCIHPIVYLRLSGGFDEVEAWFYFYPSVLFDIRSFVKSWLNWDLAHPHHIWLIFKSICLVSLKIK